MAQGAGAGEHTRANDDQVADNFNEWLLSYLKLKRKDLT
jgi:hypothetical protein